MRALIIGGGIAGPVMALALRKAGIEGEVFEAYETEADGIGGILALAPNGLDAFKTVGLDEGVRSIGRPMNRMVISDGRGKRLGEFGGLPGLPVSQLVWRTELYRMLHDHAAAQGVKVSYGKQLVSVSETPDGVTALFADGSAASGDILIGADGINSTVRRLIDPRAPGPIAFPLQGLGGYSTFTLPEEPDAMHFVFGSRAFLGYWTQPDGGTAVFSNLPTDPPLSITEARKVPKAEWLRRLRAAHAQDVPGRDLTQNLAADDLFVFGPTEMMPPVPHWHRGRIVLVGDSAHAPSSTSGQGASLAVESAVELARCLRDIPDVPAAFRAYEGLRRPRVEKIAADAAKNNNRKAAGPLGRALFSLLAPVLMKLGNSPKRLAEEQAFRIDWEAAVAV